MRSLDSLDRYLRYALLLGEDTYSSPAAQSPDTARRVKGLYPSLAGDLSREQRRALFLPSTIGPGTSGFRIVMLEQFNWFDSTTKTFTPFYFAGVHIGSGTAKLFKQKVGTDSDWVEVTEVGTLAAFPVGVAINNLFHLSDGTSSWIFDGSTWVKDGLERPTTSPSIRVTGSGSVTGGSPNITSITRTNGVVSVTLNAAATIPLNGHVVIAGVTDASFDGTFVVSLGGGSVTNFSFSQTGADATSSGGTVSYLGFTVVSNRYYWVTFVDKTATRLHESSSSARSVGTGAVSDEYRGVCPSSGTASITSGVATVTGSGTEFSSSDIGKKIRLDNSGVPNTQDFTITAVADKQHLTVSPVPTQTISSARYMIFPSRATYFRLYASSSEEDKAGLLVEERLILGDFSTEGKDLFIALDQSPFLGEVDTYFQNIERPLRNDPTPATKVMSVHKRRIFRRRESQPNYINFTSYEEVLNLLVGAPEECVPGADADTISDRVNETSYPNESDRVTAMTSHGGALFVGTDTEVSPLFGESIDDFAFSDVTAFSVGVAGKHAMKTCPFGLIFGSSDRKIYLYPSQTPAASNATASLVELSRPKRPTFEGMNYLRLDEWFIVHYNWGRRNWLVTAFNTGTAPITLVFDFETKTWMELAQAYSAIAVWKIGVGQGKRVLIGGTDDGKVYVIDDLTGTYAGSGDYSEGIFRTAPLDFGKPERDHVIYAIEYEKSDDTMPVTTTVYLDPDDPDDPTNGIVVDMQKTKIGFNRYRGFINGQSGGTCHRAMIELKVAAGTVDGKLTGLAVYAEHVPLFGAK